MSREAMRAIYKGDIDKLSSLINSGLDIHSITEKEHWSFLHRALVSVTMKSSPKMIKHLITQGVDVNKEDFYGNTPLHYACRSGDAEIVRVLLDADSNVNHVNEDGITPLKQLFLSKPFSPILFELLLINGANLEYSNDAGITDKQYIETVVHGDDAFLLEIMKKYS